MDRVLARESSRLVVARNLNQRTNADIDAQNVFSRGWTAKIACRCLQNELDLFFERRGLGRWLVDWRICGANNGVPMPRNSEHDPAVAGMGNHDGGATAQKGLVENQMDSLAGADHGFGIGFIEPAYFIGEDPGGVHDDSGGELKILPAFPILHDYSVDEIVGAFRQLHGGSIVQDSGSMIDGGCEEVHE